MATTSAFDYDWMKNEIDGDFSPSTGGGKLDDLPDGEYEFTIDAAKIKPKTNMLILEMDLLVTSEGKHKGQKIQHSLFIKDKDSAARVGKDLKTLGLDCEEWTKANDRPFSGEIMKVPKVLRGLGFRAKKVANRPEGKDKTYHNLYINKRVPTDGKPERIGPEQLNAPDPEGDPFADVFPNP